MKRLLVTTLLAVAVSACVTGCGKSPKPEDTGMEAEATTSANATPEATVSEESVKETEPAVEAEGANSEKEELIEFVKGYGDNYEDYYDEENILKLSKLYEMAEPVENPVVEISKWNRTNTHSAFSGDIDIISVDNEGFKFNAEVFYYSNMGFACGEAKFVTDNIAIYEYDELVLDSKHYVIFKFEDDCLNVYATATSGDLGFGMNVAIDGEYTTDEPTYTNANVYEETFSEEERNILDTIIPEEYYEDSFKFTISQGVLLEETDADGNRVLNCFVPTLGCYYEFTITISDDDIITIVFGDGTQFSNEQ